MRAGLRLGSPTVHRGGPQRGPDVHPGPPGGQPAPGPRLLRAIAGAARVGPIPTAPPRRLDRSPRGGLFRREWFEGQSIDRRELPDDLELCRYWDLAATEPAAGSDPDHTAGVLLGRSDQGLWYVCDVRRTRSTPLEVERLVAATAERDAAWCRESGRSVPAIRMEQEPGSAGVAVIDHYRQQVLAPYDFGGVRSTGSKETRARPVAARCEGGDVRLCRGTWNTEFLDELTAFP
ncbi:MAG: phage terminase large subunit, partial [Actinomycetota bacterium]